MNEVMLSQNKLCVLGMSWIPASASDTVGRELISWNVFKEPKTVGSFETVFVYDDVALKFNDDGWFRLKENK